MNNILFDTNVLLTGIFVPNSYSSKALAKLKSGELTGYTSQSIVDEAHRIIERAKVNTGIDLKEDFDSILGELPLEYLSPVSQEEAEKYDKVKGDVDKIIVALAKRNNLTICTNDNPLIKRANGYDITMTDPYCIMFDGVCRVEDYIQCTLSNPNEGGYFIQATSCWKDLYDMEDSNRMHCIVDSPGIGGLYLSYKHKGIVFIADNGPFVSIGVDDLPAGENEIILAVSYNCRDGLSIYLNSITNKVEKKATWSPPGDGLASGSLFRGRKGDFGAAAGLRILACFPRYLHKGAVKNLLRKDAFWIAHPLERLSLEDIARIYLAT